MSWNKYIIECKRLTWAFPFQRLGTGQLLASVKKEFGKAFGKRLESVRKVVSSCGK